MPEHALYYPEWVISDPLFLAESLLYWDRLYCEYGDVDSQSALRGMEENEIYTRCRVDEKGNDRNQIVR